MYGLNDLFERRPFGQANCKAGLGGLDTDRLTEREVEIFKVDTPETEVMLTQRHSGCDMQRRHREIVCPTDNGFRRDKIGKLLSEPV